VLRFIRRCRLEVGFVVLERFVSWQWAQWSLRCKKRALARWMARVKDINAEAMARDKRQWTLHAASNARRDLQAWYHATFAADLYRLRGPFWYKEASLPDYSSHPLGDDKGASGASSSSDPAYAAMAATMYTIRATLPPPEYALFERLTTAGAVVLKHPFRNGSASALRVRRSPQKKVFQLSLVQGDNYLFMYLTWKGKHGTQGVELASVDELKSGLETDVLKRKGHHDDSKTDCFLSLITKDRSLDLCFDSPNDRALWASTLAELTRLEKDVKAASSSAEGSE